ncbi:EpsG family protein [Chryseobacterium capnotolerans]|uniref:EpsG family protein n=1 Tax=Chryseobacterium TaxID=59732 RepID=UPI00083B3BDC|nr:MULTISPECIES: EpsG family protein [Chryseobacterium]UHO39173.1 EpsG family protein [Chryseobacterium capnotolerans]
MERKGKIEFNLLTVLTYLVSPFLALPLILYGMIKNMRMSAFFYGISVAFVSFLYIPPFEWDKARHMEFYNFSKILSLKEFFEINFKSQPDFIFRLLLFIGAQININVHYIFFFVTFITVYLIFKVYFKEYNKPNIIGKYSLLIVPLFIFSISYTDIISGLRYTLAISFIFYGYYTGLLEKKKSSVIWILLGVFTHFSVILFALLFIFFPLTKNIKLKWLKLALLFSTFFILIPEKIMLQFFVGIGMGDVVDAKLNAYLDKTVIVEVDSFAVKVINFFNVIWVIILNGVLLLRKNKNESVYVRILMILLITTNIFISFPIIYNRYNLFLKLFLVLFLLREEVQYNKIKLTLVFTTFLFMIFFNQIIVMRVVLVDMLQPEFQKWSFIYTIFENNFGLKDIK